MNRIDGNPTDDYIKAPGRLDLLSEDGRLIAATAQRTGITRPGYIDKAVYRISWADGREDDTYYVYHNGLLTPSQEWHGREENRVHREAAPAYEPSNWGEPGFNKNRNKRRNSSGNRAR